MNCGQIQMEDIVRGNIATNVFMTAHYNKIRKSVKEIEVKNKLSATLTTKILMGTLGCVLAYDRYFIDGVKGQKVTTGIYNIKSLLKLVDFYDTNCVRLEETRKRLKVYDLPYPQMRLLDMGFWQSGFERDADKGLRVAY